jgi:hypothetical protein
MAGVCKNNINNAVGSCVPFVQRKDRIANGCQQFLSISFNLNDACKRFDFSNRLFRPQFGRCPYHEKYKQRQGQFGIFF